ncbi:hypothetical protein [Methylophaga sp. OBS4]|uniref:hypothetical protein n=1 Tax=Methylophaga sp. OBS4 TaxID=2991935 RepID=UPI0022591C60|nr:hypothetical protein [Methylophaga sp. OBS4]MCX4188247.1 hypothetical protein [Methylophaga sp. OBS4]
MNEIPRLYHHNMLIVNTSSQVAPARPVADKTQSVGEFDRRRHAERRKRNKKPAVERRVSSDRRGPRFDAKA